ncbi:hypothetical protein [Amycolatopsis sp. NPDC054798]
MAESDFLAADLGTYDLLRGHHLDFEPALMRGLLRPLVVVGLARNDGRGRADREDAAPLARPGGHAEDELPAARRSVRYRRHVLRRYSLTWQKPT